MKSVEIYTDGACSGNPGRGGWGAVLIYKGREKELSGGFKLTTNNRMEIFASIAALEVLREPCEAALYSDSRYLVDAIEKGWVKRWKAKNWMRTATEPALNTDLWARMLPLLEYHKVKFIWVKGHASNKYNNRCDELAVAAAQNDNLPNDTGYRP